MRCSFPKRPIVGAFHFAIGLLLVFAAASLRADGGTYRLSWPGDRTLRTLRWEVATSAVDLLTAGRLDRVGECPACGWLFLDTSKNRSRRWCSMATCGGRDKARRYYARHTTR